MINEILGFFENLFNSCLNPESHISKSEDDTETPINSLRESRIFSYDNKMLHTCSTQDRLYTTQKKGTNFYTDDFVVDGNLPKNSLIILEVKGIGGDSITYHLNKKQSESQKVFKFEVCEEIPNRSINFGANIGGIETNWNLNPSSSGRMR